MSWDVMINRYDGPPLRASELPDDFRFPAMGDADTVRAQVSSVCPAVDWSDPAWGILEAGDYSIEFNLQKAGLVDGFMLHVRGGGDPVAAIAQLCAANRWVALDTSTGEFMDLANPSHAGWDAFRSFRDQIVGQLTGRQPWYRRFLKMFARQR